jgi:hypothetical protein
VRVDGVTLHPDLVYPEWRLALEYEGDGHRTDPRQWRHDIWRREALESAGYRVVRVHSGDVLAQPEQFLARLLGVIASRGADERAPWHGQADRDHVQAPVGQPRQQSAGSGTL